MRDGAKNVELAPLISEISQLDLEDEPREKYSVSTNPLDIANDSDDSDSVPIWLRKKNQKSSLNRRDNRRRDSDRGANHSRRDSEKSERRNSDRDQRENREASTFHWNEGGERRLVFMAHKLWDRNGSENFLSGIGNGSY